MNGQAGNSYPSSFGSKQAFSARSEGFLGLPVFSASLRVTIPILARFAFITGQATPVELLPIALLTTSLIVNN